MCEEQAAAHQDRQGLLNSDLLISASRGLFQDHPEPQVLSLLAEQGSTYTIA